MTETNYDAQPRIAKGHTFTNFGDIVSLKSFRLQFAADTCALTATRVSPCEQAYLISLASTLSKVGRLFTLTTKICLSVLHRTVIQLSQHGRPTALLNNGTKPLVSRAATIGITTSRLLLSKLMHELTTFTNVITTPYLQ
jgi:hypothetical protein